MSLQQVTGLGHIFWAELKSNEALYYAEKSYLHGIIASGWNRFRKVPYSDLNFYATKSQNPGILFCRVLFQIFTVFRLQFHPLRFKLQHNFKSNGVAYINFVTYSSLSFMQFGVRSLVAETKSLKSSFSRTICLKAVKSSQRFFVRSGCCQTSGSSEKSDKSLVTDVWQQRKVG